MIWSILTWIGIIIAAVIVIIAPLPRGKERPSEGIYYIASIISMYLGIAYILLAGKYLRWW